VRALVDTNVALDWLFDRKPWSDEAQPLWNARDAGRVVAYLPASVLTDIFYIARRHAGIDAAFTAIDRVLAAFGLLHVDGALMRQARALPGNDFEDSVQMPVRWRLNSISSLRAIQRISRLLQCV
jgi:predicted nucleic acid-binding protein